MNAQTQHSHDRTLLSQKMWVGLENMTFDAETKYPVQWRGNRDVEEEVVTLVSKWMSLVSEWVALRAGGNWLRASLLPVRSFPT